MIEVLGVGYLLIGALIALSVLFTLPRGRLADSTETALAVFMFLFGPLLVAFLCATVVTLLGLSTLSSVVNKLLIGEENAR